MEKVQITYDEYDELCEIMASLPVNSKLTFPEIDHLRTLEDIDIRFFLSLLVWLIEKQDNFAGLPETKKKSISYINKLILGRIDFVEERTVVDEEKCDIQRIPYDCYKELYAIAESADYIKNGWFPSLKRIEKVFRPTIRYSFGFILILLVKNRDFNQKEEYIRLQEILHAHYSMYHMKKTLEIKKEDFDKLIKSIKNLPLNREFWLPTKEEIENIIVPNFDKCFDFILWILEEKPKYVTKENEDIFKLLKRVFDQNVRIIGEEEVEWL